MVLRYGVRFKTDADAGKRLKDLPREKLGAAVWKIISKNDERLPAGSRYLRLSSLPAFADDEIDKGEASNLTAQFSFSTFDAVKAFEAALNPDAKARLGRDPRVAVADLWHPANATAGVFGTRRMAHDLIGVDALHQAGAKGQGVNVVIVDMGVEANWVRATRRRFGGSQDENRDRVHGWSRYDSRWDGTKWIRDPRISGQAAGEVLSAHGAMVARCVLSIAPEARIWDVPFISDAVFPPGLSTATELLNRVRAFKQHGTSRFWYEGKKASDDEYKTVAEEVKDQPWVVVNAWGVVSIGMLPPKDRQDNTGEYGDHPDHFLVDDVPPMDKAGIDVLFCATNCGEPGPDTRCQASNRGPGSGIMGINAHPGVLTVGSVRADGGMIAQSSQGPGRLARMWAGSHAANSPDHTPLQAFEKPDLCAPSHFTEDDDATEASVGTSAAVAVAAGVMAALRSVKGAAQLSPAEMRAVLRQSTMKAPGQFGWDPRLGYGVINAAKALVKLKETITQKQLPTV
jgi:hypothetical protein